MERKRARIIQIVIILVFQSLVLFALQAFLSGLQITSLWSALGAAFGYAIAQAIFWYVFIEFLAWLPEILYPFLTFLLSGGTVLLVQNKFLPGITVDTWVTGLWITLGMTVANAVLGELLSLDEDNIFDHSFPFCETLKTRSFLN